MGLFDAIKDAFTVDDGERLDAAQKELAKLQSQLQAAKDRNDINQIADIQGRIAAAEGQIKDLQAKLGQTPADAAAADAPAAPAYEPDPMIAATPTPAEPAPAPEAAAPAAEAAAPAPAAPAAPVTPPPPPAPKPQHEDYRTYTVKPGDTLSKIGREFGVTYQAIAKLNNIPNPDLIYPGQVFKIPHS